MPDGCWLDLFNLIYEIIKIDGCIPQSALESEPINFGMKSENNPPSVWMLHFDMAALAMDFNESHAL
jgi:hypothetical protein